jgi:hypothetical protein
MYRKGAHMTDIRVTQRQPCCVMVLAVMVMVYTVSTVAIFNSTTVHMLFIHFKEPPLLFRATPPPSTSTLYS